MVNKCFAPTCSSGNMSCEYKCSIFRAPKDEKHLILWRKAIPRADRILTQSDFVCEKHFEECDIIKEWISDDGSFKNMATLRRREQQCNGGTNESSATAKTAVEFIISNNIGNNHHASSFTPRDSLESQ